ncbi:MAG: lipid A export permease/ATP-binding protein MsbA [Candidatus Schekmanbacteria bacterium]|nr:lipid A export permease/ATP-binding protein MsbA [Candidatus Schekmanbacteria bacterium]
MQSVKLYKRLWPYIIPHLAKIIFAMLLALLISGAEGATAWLVKPALDDIFLKKSLFMLKILPLAVVVIYVIKGFARFGQAYLMHWVGERIIMNLRNEVYRHLQELSLSFFHNNPSPVLMARITNDVGMLANVCSQVLAEFFRESFTLIILLGVIFYRDWKLALAYVVCLPLLVIPVTRVGKKLRKISRKNQEKMGDLNTVLHETFTGCKIVKAFGMEDYEYQRFQKENDKLYQLKMKGVWVDEMLSPTMEFFGAVGTAVVIWYGGLQVFKGTTTPGTFFSFLVAIGMLYNPVRRLSKMNSTFQQSMAAAERIFEVIDIQSEIQEKPDAVELGGFKREIVFDQVNFRYYNDGDLVLKNINLTVNKGQMVAFVGASGAGKSTLMDLIPRFYDTLGGNVKIDGIDVRDLKFKALRSHIAVVGQETILFNDTIANNIAYGSRDASMEKIIAAAKGAHAHEFIEEMPDGYNTIAGERGVKLSGGQRKRITIARALLKNPEILILDEATSELDSQSEKLVQEALEILMAGRTTLVIAHRLSTIRHADKIIVLDSGRIVETGTHDELIAKGGVYKHLYDIQFLGQAEEVGEV